MATARNRIRRAVAETLESRALFNTTAPAYLVPTAPSVQTVPLLTVGDAVPETGNPAGSYRMVGIPDGLGAYDNGNGTITVLMNHELSSTAGVPRDHGSAGSFVSKFVIDKNTKQVISGDDLIKSVRVFDPITRQYVSMTTMFNRLCSADLPAASAFFNPATGAGTPERIFLNGEETTNGRAFGHVVTGPQAGVSYELPYMGKFAWENAVASPTPQDKTIVMGLDDSSRNFSSEGATDPSEVYLFVGNKGTGGPSAVHDAGLVNGVLNAIRVGVPGNYDVNELTVASNERFEVVQVGDGDSSVDSAATLQAETTLAGATQFRRVEDGHFDPNNPNDFYYTTTDQFGGTTRIWRLRFDDITNPQSGGTITIAVDSPPGAAGEMFDNLTVDQYNHVLVQEDPGNQAYLAKVRQYDLETGDQVQILQHNPALFDPTVAAPADFLTQDEESSGIIDVSDLLGGGWYVADVQAHFNINAASNRFNFPNPNELVQGGQLLLVNTNAPTATLANGVLTMTGTVNDDQIFTFGGDTLVPVINGQTLGRFSRTQIRSIVVEAGAGSDWVSLASNLDRPTLVRGGLGDDRITGTGGRNILIGEEGRDELIGRGRDDLLIANRTTRTTSQLQSALNIWAGTGTYTQRVNALRGTLVGSIINDGRNDRLTGMTGREWFLTKPGDVITDLAADELVN